MIKDKRSRLYREGLEHLFKKTVDQLQKIKSLTLHPAGAEQMGWKFITDEQITEIDEYIKVSEKEDQKDSICPYQSESVFSNSELFDEIRKMIKMIHEI